MDRELAGLLRACKAEPFDHVRRLVLADWLEEHGDADRAELVRIQVRLADTWGDEPELAGLRERAALLERRNAERWLGPAKAWYESVDFCDGFLYLAATSKQLLAHPPTELPDDVIPWLEQLYLTDAATDAVLVAPWLGAFSRLVFSNDRRLGETLGLLLDNPAIEQVATLRLCWHDIGPDAARVLARCERLAGLRELQMGGNPLSDEGAAELANAPWLGGLQRLDLGGTVLRSDGYRALFGNDRLKGLKRLDLSNTEFDSKMARVLARCEALAGLEALNLEDCELEAAALRALSASPHLRPTEADFDYVPLGMEGLRALLAGKLLEKVRTMHFSGNNFTPEAASVLLSSPRLASMEFLRIWDPIGDAGCAALAANRAAGRLRYLSFDGAGIGAAGATTLGRAKALGALTGLSLDNNPIGPHGAAALCGDGLPALALLGLTKAAVQTQGAESLARSGASRLVSMGLADNGLGDRAAKALAKMRLAVLNLNRNRIGPKGAAALAEMSSLRVLSLYTNRIGDDGAKALAASGRLGELIDLDVRKNGLTRGGANALKLWPQRERMSGMSVEDKGIPKKLLDAVRIG